MRFPVTSGRAVVLVGLLVLVCSVGASGAGATGARTTSKPSGLTVFAAASLSTVLPQINSGNTYSFGSTTALGTQIVNGAPADVLMGANTTEAALLYSEGLVDQPVNYTRNTLAVVVPKANPANISSVYDLEKAGVTIDEANSTVPVGSYTLQVLNQMGINSAIQANVVSQETDDTNVVTKVATGQVDAGFVYLSDYIEDPSQLTLITVPAWAQPKITYAMAVVKKSPNQANAQAFEQEILSPAAQSFFVKDGFLPISAPAPTISRFTPGKVAPGKTIKVKGTNFKGVTSVVFSGGVPAKFKVSSNFNLVVTVPTKAKTGTFAVTNPAGTVISKVLTIT